VAGVDKSVRHFFDLCADAGPADCAVAVTDRSGAQLQQTYDAFLMTLDYDRAKLVRKAFFDALYFGEPIAFTNYAKVLSGYYKDTSTIKKRSDEKRQSDWNPESVPASSSSTLSAITCGDVVERYQGSPENFKKWLIEYQKVSKYGGDLLVDILYQCSVWTVDAKDRYMGLFRSIQTKTPILFLNSEYDPVTPLISARNSSDGFVGSRVLSTSGVGVSIDRACYHHLY
jgi:hypothetical protein